MQMQQFKVRVTKGRLILDVPTDLPEGKEVTLSVEQDDDEFDPDELDDQLDDAELQRSLEISVEQLKAGQFVDGAAVLARLRGRS